MKIRNDELVAQLAAEVEQAEQAEAQARQQTDDERQPEEALAEKRARKPVKAVEVRTREATEGKWRSETRRRERVEARLRTVSVASSGVHGEANGQAL